MVALTSNLDKHEKEALLIMFGSIWAKRFWPLDGRKGRPSISQCIDFAMRKKNVRARDDLVGFLENYLTDMARRCTESAKCDS